MICTNKYCHHQWQYKGDAKEGQKVTCPRCYRKITILKQVFEGDE